MSRGNYRCKWNLTDSRYVEAVNTILTIEDEILVNDKKNLNRDDYSAFFMFCENVGFEENFVTYAEYKELLQKYRVNLMETENIVESQRVIKEDKEIQYIISIFIFIFNIINKYHSCHIRTISFIFTSHIN